MEMKNERSVRRNREAMGGTRSDPSRQPDPSESVVYFDYLRSQDRATSPHDPVAAPIGASFAPEDATLLTQGLDEACSFLLQFGSVEPAKRRQMALAIIRHASEGMRDPHRLAIKAIVAVA